MAMLEIAVGPKMNVEFENNTEEIVWAFFAILCLDSLLCYLHTSERARFCYFREADLSLNYEHRS